MKNADNPINPTTETKYHDGEKYNLEHLGLTKREYFAGLAMQSLVNATNVTEESLISKIIRFLGLKGWKVKNNLNYENIAKSSIEISEQLLNQLNQNK